MGNSGYVMWTAPYGAWWTQRAVAVWTALTLSRLHAAFDEEAPPPKDRQIFLDITEYIVYAIYSMREGEDVGGW